MKSDSATVGNQSANNIFKTFRLNFAKKEGKENAKITYGAHPGRRRAYLPGRFEFLDADGRVGCGIDGSTSLCRKMGKEVSETKNKKK